MAIVRTDMNTFVVAEENGSLKILQVEPNKNEFEYMNLGTQPRALANMFCDLLNYGVQVGFRQGVEAGFEQAALNAKSAQNS